MAETTTRYRDVVELLEEQHREIAGLFELVHDSVGEDKTAGLRRLLRLLAAHEIAEEEVIHPTVGRLRRGAGAATARKEEEKQIKQAVDDLERLGPDHAEFRAHLLLLRDWVLDHMRAEESEEFPLVRSLLNARERRSMLERVRLAEGFAPALAHTPAGAEPAGWEGTHITGSEVLLGPFREMAETIRDALRVEDQRRTGKR